VRGAAASMTVLRPRSAREALTVFARTPDALPIVGGTDVMVAWNLGELNGRTMLDLSRLSEWSRIERADIDGGAPSPRAGSRAQDSRRANGWHTHAALRIGALVTHTALQRDRTVRERFPLLVAACATVGGVQIQNRGTIGGNIANASPAGDTLPPLAVYDAIVHVAGAAGRRRVPFLDIFAGVKRTTLQPGELIEAIELPFPSPSARAMFRKVGTRAAQAISKTVAAGLLWLAPDGAVQDVRLALGSMAPTVRRLRSVESALIGQRLTPDIIRDAVSRLPADVAPIDDVRSTAAYRLLTSQQLIAAFLSGDA
jgi:CO/xanthine dehydrogenase FAD-binding subunit